VDGFTSLVFLSQIRNVACGFCSVLGRAGGALAPQVLRLGGTYPFIPFAVFLSVAFVNTIAFAAFIPETKGHRLPEHMPDKVDWWCGGGRKASGDGSDSLTGDLLEK
jgi:hypothetical protein